MIRYIVPKIKYSSFRNYYLFKYLKIHREFSRYVFPKKYELDYEYLCNPQNFEEIQNNIKERRMPKADIIKVIHLSTLLKNEDLSDEERKRIQSDLEESAVFIPNRGHPRLLAYGNEPKIVKHVNEMPQIPFESEKFEDFAKTRHLFRMDPALGSVSIKAAYNLKGSLAELEQALIKYTISKLIRKGFNLISVPDILPSKIFESCGMTADSARGHHSQIFMLEDEDNMWLSGTAEMGIGAYLQNKSFKMKDLPIKFVCVSRCFRKEVGATAKDAGIVRVKFFTKVEMFGITANEIGNESEDLYQEFVNLQIDLYSELGFHFKVLDMPLSELAMAAYTKTDVEAYLPTEKEFVEISSASNCTDYQSRRLITKYMDSEGKYKFVHTVNGTACAIPRCLLILVSTNRENIPEVLRPFLKYSKMTFENPKTNILKNSNLKQSTDGGWVIKEK